VFVVGLDNNLARLCQHASSLRLEQSQKRENKNENEKIWKSKQKRIALAGLFSTVSIFSHILANNDRR
jgi:hypothetical protein